MQYVLIAWLVLVVTAANAAVTNVLTNKELEYVAAIEAASNDVVAVKAAYDSIRWDKIKHPAKFLRALSKAMKGSKKLVELRREVKTKFMLVREGDDGELDDVVTPTPVPVVQIYKVPIAEVVVDPISIESLLPEISLWRSRYNSRLDRGLNMARNSVLGADRRLLEASGTNYDKALQVYNSNVKRALDRRVVLSGRESQ